MQEWELIHSEENTTTSPVASTKTIDTSEYDEYMLELTLNGGASETMIIPKTLLDGITSSSGKSFMKYLKINSAISGFGGAYFYSDKINLSSYKESTSMTKTGTKLYGKKYTK